MKPSHPRPLSRSGLFAGQGWMVLIGVIAAVCLLAYYVQLLNQSVARGHEFREGQRLSAEAGRAAPRTAAAARVAQPLALSGR